MSFSQLCRFCPLMWDPANLLTHHCPLLGPPPTQSFSLTLQALPPCPHLQLMAAITRCSPCSTITFCQAVLHKDILNTSKHLINTPACQSSAHDLIFALAGTFPPLQPGCDPLPAEEPPGAGLGGLHPLHPRESPPGCACCSPPQPCTQARHPDKICVIPLLTGTHSRLASEGMPMGCLAAGRDPEQLSKHSCSLLGSAKSRFWAGGKQPKKQSSGLSPIS